MTRIGRNIVPIGRLRAAYQSLTGGLAREEGQGLAEYSFILLLVAVACVGALGVLKDGVLSGLEAGANMFP